MAHVSVRGQSRRNAWEAARLAAAGALAGLAGGAAMAVLAMIFAVSAHLSPWHPLEWMIAEVTRAAAPRAGLLPLGLFLHAGVSALLGVLFAALLGEFPIEVLVPAGALYGLAIWLALRYVIFPQVDFAAAGAAPALITEHLAYGSLLWLLVPIDSWLERRR